MNLTITIKLGDSKYSTQAQTEIVLESPNIDIDLITDLAQSAVNDIRFQMKERAKEDTKLPVSLGSEPAYIEIPKGETPSQYVERVAQSLQ